jgi:hypothetical protein
MGSAKAVEIEENQKGCESVVKLFLFVGKDEEKNGEEKQSVFQKEREGESNGTSEKEIKTREKKKGFKHNAKYPTFFPERLYVLCLFIPENPA